jgi:hypothetical protein
MKSYVVNTLLAIASTCIALLLPEGIYRLKKISDGEERTRLNYRLASSVYGQFDPEFGQRFVPGSSFNYVVVRGGVVKACLGVIASANADGLGGRATLSDYRSAEIKLFTTGDSFTHWKRNGLTIPDVVGDLVTQRTHKRTANLNLARGGYGLLHMLVMSSRLGTSLQPDAIVIQFISDDLVRGWWYTKEAKIDGRTRALIGPRMETFEDSVITNDEYVVDSAATDQWCEERKKNNDRDGVLTGANQFYLDYVKAKGIGVNVAAVDRLYVYDYLYQRIVGVRLFRDHNIIPQITASELAANALYRESVAALRKAKIPLVLIHLPLGTEIRRGKPALNVESRRIWEQLERDLGVRVSTFFDLKETPQIPQSIDLSPWDGHPNAEGIAFYGRYVDQVLSEVLTSAAVGLRASHGLSR